MEAKKSTNDIYQERINKVLLYINNHLDEDLDLKKLAEMSHFSSFHFHRIIRAYLNEPLGSYIIRNRLQVGARLLELSDLEVGDIAIKTGYDNISSFSKAFKQRFGVSPNEFRETKSQIDYSNYIINNMEKIELKPSIKNIKNMKVVYIQSIEPYGGQKMQNSWPKLFEFVKKNKLFSFGMEFLGISYDDPSVTEPERCRYESCITVRKEVKPEGEIGYKELEGGKYAIFKYKGPYEKLGEIYAAIYKGWLPSSGYDLREAPCFDKYLNSPDSTKPENLKTEIYVPIK